MPIGDSRRFDFQMIGLDRLERPEHHGLMIITDPVSFEANVISISLGIPVRRNYSEI